MELRSLCLYDKHFTNSLVLWLVFFNLQHDFMVAGPAVYKDSLIAIQTKTR